MKLQKDQETLFYFRPFVDYQNNKQSEVAIKENKRLSEGQKEVIIESRRGQGKYRQKLLDECPFCPITMVNDERLLVASHIKPWVKSNNTEKVDHKNGFIFTPTYDSLFDRGFISFMDDGTMLVSPWLSPLNQKRLNIFTGKKVPKLPTEGREKYLAYHREYVFKR